MNPSSVAAVYDRRSFRNTIRSSSAVIDRRYSKTLLIAAMLPLTACSSAVTPDKMAQIKPAMNASQVEAILGRPARIDQSETADQTLSGEVDHYPAPNGEGRVIFVNHAVFKAEFVPGAKS
jgi:hypothetical protein